MQSPILAPAAVLVLWSIVMLFWMAGARFSAISKLPKSDPVPAGIRGQDIDPLLPPQAAWKSHNYTHLMEQPTIFYAVVGILALADAGTGLNLWLAWGYTGLRIVHSVWQATVNTLVLRFPLFLISTLCLTALAVNAVRATLG
jgi:MAPEG family